MDDLRIGRLCRALRRRRGWRQLDLAAAAGCHQTTVSRLERGHLATLSIEVVRRIFALLDARFEGVVSWRGGDLDRLADARHAQLVEAAARVFAAAGWTLSAEVSFSEWGERGSIDLLAVLPDRRIAVVNEIKTEITSVEETVRRHDAKVRLGAGIVRQRLGWRPLAVARVLILADQSTCRRAVARHSATFASIYPLGSRVVRAWIRNPSGQAIGGLWFLSSKHGRAEKWSRGGPKRIRTRSSLPTTRNR